MLNFYSPFFMPCFGSHFENGRHLENFKTSFNQIKYRSNLNLRYLIFILSEFAGGRRGCDRMVVGFTTTLE
jgi:hypothetical protein